MRPRRGYPTRGSRRVKEQPASGPSSSTTGVRHQVPPRSSLPPQPSSSQPQSLPTRAPRELPPSAGASTGNLTLSPPASSAFSPPQPAAEGRRHRPRVRTSSTCSMTIHRIPGYFASTFAAIKKPQPPPQAPSRHVRSDVSTATSDASPEDSSPEREIMKTRIFKKRRSPCNPPDSQLGVNRQCNPIITDDPAMRSRTAGPAPPPSHSRRVSPQCASVLAVASPPAASTSAPPDDLSPPAMSPPPPLSPPRSFASVASEPAANAPTSSPQPITQPLYLQPKPKYPPLVVESLPNWHHHLGEIKKQLGRLANVRPFGKGIRFSPTEEDEYQIVRRYLTNLEATDKVSWYSYSPPDQTDVKVAIRGMPYDTPPDLMAAEFAALGFTADYIRPICTKGSYPGCIHHGVFQRTTNIEDLYQVTELLGITGVIIEAWRGKRRPAQCHRCQQFRHSSHHCHRPLACVRCGGEHAAMHCSRPREAPATCCNCGGPHPANYSGCPVIQREARNRRAGPLARSRPLSGRQTGVPPVEQPTVSAEPQASNLMAPANPASQPQKTKTKKKPKKKSAAVATPITDVATPITCVTTRTAAAVAPPASATTTSSVLRDASKRRPATAAAQMVPLGTHQMLISIVRLLQELLSALAAGRPYDELTFIVTVGLADVLAQANPPTPEEPTEAPRGQKSTRRDASAPA
ncbi:gag-like protein [Lymantria xylina nucleopolyhedrovirus]|uniref:Gag-like protein n=1 Tax=Lymantria xylina multiple nucleopolyhedrovirus TaxID=2847840 RepID=D4N2G8_9ABAC|nr:gag-like protein [Lymantria xylina nucleopolyhedrovirus]ADD73840.1 gag-like protein [Lymantria xylina nucleopolyhedrovirus]